ncbi:MAG: hypothetical protein KDH15_04445 [Rhodocyclaceae bacterium]|nr:hypothetical protein [Rhodocyclaceae bacterium]
MADGPRATAPDFSPLTRLGLNMHAILPLASLERCWLDRLAAQIDLSPWRRIVVLANGGPLLWRTMAARGIAGDDPVDRFSVTAVVDWFASHGGDLRWRTLYPGEVGVDLQALGRAVGWHQPSPLMLGMHPRWGSWFGYRVVMLTDADWPGDAPTAPAAICARCEAKPCVDACPAGAVGVTLDIERCIGHRLLPESACAADCAARLACPAGAEHRYDEAQRRHCYTESLRAIRRWRGGQG